ncbi:hypothetical protein ACQPXM_23980 [Kribbella sp. CA-253562]|uniref:hypothetical protein n=1 Tax=Kribbella sp. CA-253562 TaxID=3239942 RepID=UPI003D8F8D89
MLRSNSPPAAHRPALLGFLLTASVGTGLFLVGSTPASAQEAAPVRPPVLSNVRVACHESEAGVLAKLRNPNSTEQEYMVAISGGDVHYDYVVRPPAHGSERIGFGGLPDRTYSLRVQNAVGDFVAQTEVRVRCHATPPTGTPSATPTASAPTTAESSTPVAVPTAVDAGLSGPVAPDDSHRTIVAAGLLAAVSIIIALGSLLAGRHRRPHQH